MENDTLENIQNSPEEDVFDYDFLKPKEPTSEERSNLVAEQFDAAFTNSSKVIQDYILNDNLEESIRLICKIEKLEGEKAQVILENVAVSILVGLLPISEAKETLIESFRSSGIVLEPFAASSILKSIDTYILTDIRKKILESRLEEKKEIRHLTLKEKREEAAKEELRKILLERTGTITGKGEPLIQYKEREKSSQEIKREEEKKEEEKKIKQEMNRDSLLAKINMQNVSDTEKIRERMLQIKKEEEERLERVDARERRELERIAEIRKIEEKYEAERLADFETEQEKKENSEEKEDVSQILVDNLKEKLLAHEDEKTNLNDLRMQREEEEIELQKTKNNDFYKESMQESIPEEIPNIDDLNFDPYREGF